MSGQSVDEKVEAAMAQINLEGTAWRAFAEYEDDPPPTGIPVEDWRRICKGSGFARAVGTVMGDAEGRDADSWLDVAGEIEVALEREGYVVVRKVPEHIVTFSEDGYGLEHPVRCRPDLIGCIFNEWLHTQLAPDRDPGRYVMTWGPDDDGPSYAPIGAAA